jgi:hypothetical protein
MSTYLNNAPNALSVYNPILSLQHDAGNDFIQSVVEDFFKEKGGIQQVEQLDVSKLKTEKEFIKDNYFVKNYIYKIIVDSMKRKQDTYLIDFKPKYVITFDKSLTPYVYPYLKAEQNKVIYFGRICLGDKPLLYYLFIDLQELINYIKKYD